MTSKDSVPMSTIASQIKDSQVYPSLPAHIAKENIVSHTKDYVVRGELSCTDHSVVDSVVSSNDARYMYMHE